MVPQTTPKGPRHNRFWSAEKRVLFNPATRKYLRYDAQDVTDDRTYAWVGTRDQCIELRKQFPLAKNFTLYSDGDERQAPPPPNVL